MTSPIYLLSESTQNRIKEQYNYMIHYNSTFTFMQNINYNIAINSFQTYM